jgi:phosphoglycolate phosphatase
MGDLNMRKSYQAIIFDLDGTLLNTLEDLAASTNYALVCMGFPTRTLAEVRKFVGNGVAKLMERAVPNGTSPEEITKTLEVFKTHYAEHCEDKTAPYEGITALLDALLADGKTIAVVSNKIDSAVSVLCKKYFGDRITLCIGDKEGICKKPSPDSVNETLRILNIKKEDAVYIGDSEVDIETAKNAEMDCISVTWGFRDMDMLLDTWGLKDFAWDEKSTSKEGVFYGKGTAYFARSVQELEKILLCREK